jgi:hypothetical protein
MKKADVGFLQEEQPNGKIANSTVRVMSYLALLGLAVYMYFANYYYEKHFNTFVDLVSRDLITQETFTATLMQQGKYEEWIIMLFFSAAFAPKVIQKFIETKAGVKDKSSE